MFVGHYAASLALKSVEKNASLGMLFLAVQFVDILFSQFVLLGIERMNIIENYTASTHFELVFMPSQPVGSISMGRSGLRRLQVHAIKTGCSSLVRPQGKSQSL